MGNRFAGFGKTRIAMDVGAAADLTVSEETLRAISKDPWLSAVGRYIATAPTDVGIVAELPAAVSLPTLEIAVVDGDPRRLVGELEERLPALNQGEPSTTGDDQRFLDEFLPDDGESYDSVWMAGLDELEPVWLSWMAAPPTASPAEVLDLVRLSDPEVQLAAPSAETAWIVAGIGSRVVQNTFEAASTTDRETVGLLIRKAMQLVQRWHDERDEGTGRLHADHWLWRIVEDGRSISEALGLDLFAESDTPDRGSAWLSHSPMGSTVRQELLDVLWRVEQAANLVAPPFVRNQGRIVLNVLPPATWGSTGQKLSVKFATEGHRVLDLADLGRGTQRWTAASVREALRLVAARHEAESEESEAENVVRLLLVDEPEMALHPEAQDQVAEWCVQAGRGGQRVLIATHSPAMLELSPSDATLVKVSMVRGVTYVEPLDVEALEGLDRLADSLGLGRSGLLHLPRGFIIVEGPADAAVLSGVLGPELRRQRIVPIPLHGAHKYRALVQPELLKAMGKPMAVMFDDVRRDVLDGRRPPEANEEKTLLTLVERVPEIHPISFDAPDIIAALPDDAVRRVVPEFPGWDVVLDAWLDGPGDFKNFKAYAMHRVGRSERHATQFIMEVLEQTDPDDALPTSFRRAASEILAWADAISPIGTSGISGEELI